MINLTLQPDTLEQFFQKVMPSTKKLIEELWNLDRLELVEILKEYAKAIGPIGYGYEYFVRMQEHASTAPHDYTNPWKVL